LQLEAPDLVIVVGDVNSTIACSLVAKKMNIQVAHVEAGLRSFDRTMPEEINRILTDAISDYLFVSEPSGLEHLRSEGIESDKVFFVGNVMIDSLTRNLHKIESSVILDTFNVQKGRYMLVTLHRPSNVDNEASLASLVSILNKHAQTHKIIFPVHPRTKSKLVTYNLEKEISQNILLCDPIGYVDFINLIKNAALIITDSGGIQEESSFLNVPCLTLRNNTERPVTVEQGTNYLIGTDIAKIDKAITSILTQEKQKETKTLPMWDGKAAERICAQLIRSLQNELNQEVKMT
jgi:UDP-N-acetylglucosamine 2-epimerase (non-hydrolysing)